MVKMMLALWEMETHLATMIVIFISLCSFYSRLAIDHQTHLIQMPTTGESAIKIITLVEILVESDLLMLVVYLANHD